MASQLVYNCFRISTKYHINNIYASLTMCRNFTASSVKYSDVGFIGLGNMGSHMANNLIKSGTKLMVYDLNPQSVSNLVKQGAKSAATVKEIAQNCSRIVTMLPSSPHVLNVYTNGQEGILNNIKSGALLIDSSTIDPSVSRDIGALCEKKGVSFLDAPVSGGVGGAEAGTLTFMVGGKESDVEEAKKLLNFMGKNIVHCGDVGSGQCVKICNNMALAITMVGTAETMNLGIKLGLDPKVFAKIINVSSGRSWSSEVYHPVPGIMENVPSSKNYEGGFSATLMTKDLGLAQNAATESGSPTPLGSLCHQLYRTMMNSGYKDKDFSSIYKFLQDKN